MRMCILFALLILAASKIMLTYFIFQTMSETVQALIHSYHFIRGKSYNDRLVFSPHFTAHVLSMFRAFSRFGNVTLVGPKGMNNYYKLLSPLYWN